MAFLRGSKDSEAAVDVARQAEETQARWFDFVSKLEERMDELGEAAIPELADQFAQDDDPHHRTYFKVASGVKGQFRTIRDKARSVYDDKVLAFFRERRRDQTHAGADDLYRFQEACSGRLAALEARLDEWLERVEATGLEDLEARYGELLAEHEAIKDRFQCSQCSAPIPIDKIYFITTYLPCAACGTQNTFNPSTLARQLEHLGRGLAEQRTRPLLDAAGAAKGRERQLFAQAHNLKMQGVGVSGAERRRIDEAAAGAEQQWTEAVAEARDLYRRYLRAMFDEWNRIVPDLTVQNEAFYRRMLKDYETDG